LRKIKAAPRQAAEQCKNLAGVASNPKNRRSGDLREKAVKNIVGFDTIRDGKRKTLQRSSYRCFGNVGERLFTTVL
jgi:hypothetical protein